MAMIGIVVAIVVGGVTLFYLENNLAANEKTPSTVNSSSSVPKGKHFTVFLNESMGIRNP